MNVWPGVCAVDRCLEVTQRYVTVVALLRAPSDKRVVYPASRCRFLLLLIQTVMTKPKDPSMEKGRTSVIAGHNECKHHTDDCLSVLTYFVVYNAPETILQLKPSHLSKQLNTQYIIMSKHLVKAH